MPTGASLRASSPGWKGIMRSEVAARLRAARRRVGQSRLDRYARTLPQKLAIECRREDIDILFLYVTTYALSNTVLPLVQRAGVPVIVLNLQPEAAIDYQAFNQLQDRTAMTGEWLAFCSACPVPEIANVLMRARIPFHQVTGVLNDAETWREIEEWLAAAQVRSTLASTRLGLLGHYYGGMLDIMTDVTMVSIVLRHTRGDSRSGRAWARWHPKVSEADVARRVEEFHDVPLMLQPDCPPEGVAPCRAHFGSSRCVCCAA